MKVCAREGVHARLSREGEKVCKQGRAGVNGREEAAAGRALLRGLGQGCRTSLEEDSTLQIEEIIQGSVRGFEQEEFGGRHVHPKTTRAPHGEWFRGPHRVLEREQVRRGSRTGWR